MSDFEERQLPNIVALLHEAALMPERWSDVINALSEPFENATCSYMHFDGASQSVPTALQSGASDEWWTLYDQHYGATNPYPLQAYMQSRPGDLIYAPDLIPERDAMKTEFLSDWMAPQGLGPTHFASSLWRDPSMMALLVVVPPESIAQRKGDEIAWRLRRVIPEMQRTLDINRTLLRAKRDTEILGAALDTIPVPAFVVDQKQTMLQANHRGEALLQGRARPLRIGRAFRLTAASSSANRTLTAQIKSGFERRSTADVPPVRLTCDRTGQTFIARLVPVNRREGSSYGDGTIIGYLAPEPAMILLVTPINRHMTVPVDLVRDAFALTRSEARLVSGLVSGLTLAEFAEQSGLTRNTVRNQLTSVFAKTGTNRQASLVATVVSALSPWWEE